MTIVLQKDLSILREKHKDKKIVCCIGVFDIVHAGHILFFEDCKKYGDLLVVFIGNDEYIKSYKGEKRPILNEHIRSKTVDSLKPVDYAIIDENKNWIGKKSHEIILGSLFRELKPDVYVVNEDGVDIEERRRIAESFNVKIVVLKRWCPEEFKGISTSKIIKKIKNL